MNPRYDSALERISQLEMVYQRARQKAELAQRNLHQLEQRQQENRERLATMERQLNELQQRIEFKQPPMLNGDGW